MITEIHLKNWKSYEEGILYVDPLTVLIGTNASGKSNALDALLFLNRLSTGNQLTAILQGDSIQNPVRGGLEWAAMQPGNLFSLGVTIRFDELTDYKFDITCQVLDSRCELVSEKLQRIKFRVGKDGKRRSKSGSIYLYRTDHIEDESTTVVARLYNEKRGSPRTLGRGAAIFSQLFSQKLRQDITDGINFLRKTLSGIFILDPIPSHMRDYTPLSDQLDDDAGNIAGVMAALPKNRQQEVERIITKYISKLPEKEINRVYSERVGKFQTDAMLYCEEGWGNKDNRTSVDARGMSDGTLRFLAILVALLTRPEETLLIIEEVDNGLHPSRSSLLVEMLSEIGQQRKIDVLATTHNPALLDELGMDMVPFITVVHRDPEDGMSRLTLLEDIDQLPKLLASGTVGRLSSKGLIERELSRKFDAAS